MKRKNYVYIVYRVWYNDETLLRVFKSLQGAKKFKAEEVYLDMKGNDDLLFEDVSDEYVIKREEVH
jgi:hypothetical protein